MKRIYISGNPLLKEDSMPFKIVPRLRKKFPSVEFLELEPTDNLPEERHLKILDTVIGIDSVQVIRDIDKIVTGKVYSLHDFDLGFNLKLMKKAGKLRSVNIIGIPPHLKEEHALDQVEKTIQSLLRVNPVRQ